MRGTDNADGHLTIGNRTYSLGFNDGRPLLTCMEVPPGGPAGSPGEAHRTSARHLTVLINSLIGVRITSQHELSVLLGEGQVSIVAV